MTQIREMISEQEMLFGDLTAEEIVVSQVVQIVPKQARDRDKVYPSCNVQEYPQVAMENNLNVPRWLVLTEPDHVENAPR